MNPNPEVYTLLDSGRGRKLEAVGPYLIERQAAVAYWEPKLPAARWKQVHAFHHRSETGGGHWEAKAKMPESYDVRHGGLTLRVKLTAFGHLGFFAEQAAQWTWFRAQAARLAQAKGRAPRLLNLFGYTGGSTCAAALGGAEVTHVDAAKGVVDWCRTHLELNNVPPERAKLRVDDCIDFLKREKRRGNLYDGVILDPPTYGRGPNKQTFRIEEDIGSLLDLIRDVLEKDVWLFHMSSHTPGFSPEVLKNLLSDRFPIAHSAWEAGEMTVPEHEGGRLLPSGVFCRFAAT